MNVDIPSSLNQVSKILGDLPTMGEHVPHAPEPSLCVIILTHLHWPMQWVSVVRCQHIL